MMRKFRNIIIAAVFLLTPISALSNNISSFYYIRVKLDINKKTIEGTETITWRNSTKDFVEDLQLNLFHNGYKNQNSTFAREGKVKITKKESGYTELDFVKIVDNYNTIKSMEFVRPDDNNLSDETVLKIKLGKPVAPGEVIKINIGFVTKLPAGGIGRSGYARGNNFFFISEWYPKLGVYEEGKGWIIHQYHYWTGCYSDFSSYDVGITIPENFSMAAGTNPIKSEKNYDKEKTYFFKTAMLKDFACCASDELIEIDDEFVTSKLPPVKIKLLLQKSHLDKKNRFLYAIKNGLKYYGEWISGFPYGSITLIDLPRSFNEDNMFYPGLICLRSNLYQFSNDYSCEEDILHSLGRQYFTSSISVNSIEEPWIDDGIVTYLTGKILQKCYGDGKGVFRIVDGIPLSGVPVITVHDYPIVAFMGSAFKPYFAALKSGYLEDPVTDPIYKPGWSYQNVQTFKIGSSYKPALMLETISNYFGSNIVFYTLRSYYNRYRYSQTSTAEFITCLEKSMGQKSGWFLDQIFYGAEKTDNAVVSIENHEFKEGKYLVEIIFSRKGAVKIPVDIKVYLENGKEINDSWDANERWIKKSYISDYPATSALIDPQGKITLDVNTNNNSLTVEGNYKPVLKWAAQWLFWMQTFLQTLCSVC